MSQQKKTTTIPAAAATSESDRAPPPRLVADGEQLSECSDKEWEQGESAYSADLLNVKKKPNRVTVFAAPDKMVDATGRSFRMMAPMAAIRETDEGGTTTTKTTGGGGRAGSEMDERAKGIARLVTGVAKMLLVEETPDGVEVTVTMKVNRDRTSLEPK